MPHKVLFRRVSLCFEFHHDIERYQCIITMYRSPFYVIIYIRVAANFLKWSCFYGLPGTLSSIFFYKRYIHVHVYLRMDARRHGQEWALVHSGNVVKCFCALIFPAKRSVDELFCIIFTTCRRLLGLFPTE